MTNKYFFRIPSVMGAYEFSLDALGIHISPPFTQEVFVEIAEHFWYNLGGYENDSWPILIVIYSSDDGKEVARKEVDVETRVEFRVLE